MDVAPEACDDDSGGGVLDPRSSEARPRGTGDVGLVGLPGPCHARHRTAERGRATPIVLVPAPIDIGAKKDTTSADSLD